MSGFSGAIGTQFPGANRANNLLLWLDAGNPNSSNGLSATTWYDLSGNGWNATAFSGMTYSSNNGGYYDFSLSGGSATLASGVYNKTYTGKSVFVVANCTAINNQYRALIGNTGTRNFNFYLYNDGSANHLHFSCNGSGIVSNPLSYTPGNWFTAGVSLDTSGNMSFYFNGSLVNTSSGGAFGQYASGQTEYAGRADNYWYGPLSVIQVYGDTLVASQMQQLHNSVRGRYGL